MSRSEVKRQSAQIDIVPSFQRSNPYIHVMFVCPKSIKYAVFLATVVGPRVVQCGNAPRGARADAADAGRRKERLILNPLFGHVFVFGIVGFDLVFIFP